MYNYVQWINKIGSYFQKKISLFQWNFFVSSLNNERADVVVDKRLDILNEI